jgi:arginyl-tRNA synthetase
MSLLTDLSDLFGGAFESIGLDRTFGEVTVSQRPDLGQFQCNGALPAAKPAGRNPREIAQEILDTVSGDERISELSLAGPGFINITLTDDFLAQSAQSTALDTRLGVDEVPKARRVLVDYAGPNLSKSMHVGHLRATIIGDSLQRTARFLGHDTLGDIHLGDWGTPMGMLIIETKLRWPDLPYFDAAFDGPFPKDSPVTLDDLTEMYPVVTERCANDPGEADRARRATVDLQRGRAGYRALWQHFHDVSTTAQKRDFRLLGVEFDLWFGESDVQHLLEPMTERLVRNGVAEEDEGALIIRVEEPEDKKELPPLILRSSTGASMYGTTDLATIEYRVRELKRDLLLYVVDSRQSLHFQQVFRAARLGDIAPPEVALEHIGFGTMNGPDGKPFKTREGGVLTLWDLLNKVKDAAKERLDEGAIARDYPTEEREQIARQVGLAALKFGDLSNHRASNYVFDLDRFASFEGKTGPYLQYSAVRIKSILRKAGEQGLASGPITPASVDAERDLMLYLGRLPQTVERAFELRAPNHLAEYAYDLSTHFNRFYEACHILSESDSARQASWLALVDTTLRQLVLVLDLLGIEIPERM